MSFSFPKKSNCGIHLADLTINF